MALWNKKSHEFAEGPDALPPPPVIPWRVPPIGSMGDAWDSEIELPARQEPGAAHPPVEGARKSKRPPAQKRARFRKPAYNEVVFIEYIAPLHWCVIIAWVFVTLAFFSTGPLYPIMALLALGGVLSGIAAVLLIRTIHRDSKGETPAYVAIMCGMLLIILDAVQPNVYAYQAYFNKAARRPVTSMNYEDTMAYTETAMQLMARAAWCAYLSEGLNTVGVGRNGVNREVSGDEEYFAISTLAYIAPDKELEGLGEEFVFYQKMDLPRDPFARDPRATFGVFVTPTHILVYSIGPDGVWQINPRQPVDIYSTDPATELASKMFDPNTGRSGPGDIILVVPMDQFEEMAGICEFTRYNLKRLSDTGEMPLSLDPPPEDSLFR